MKKTIYIYIANDSEPFVFTTLKEAREAIDDEINYLKERWGYDDDEVAECYKELNSCRIDGDYVGTYLGENTFGFYVREIEV